MHTCYKINGYFKFQIFTLYHLSSVTHNATLTNRRMYVYVMYTYVIGLKKFRRNSNRHGATYQHKHYVYLIIAVSIFQYYKMKHLNNM